MKAWSSLESSAELFNLPHSDYEFIGLCPLQTIANSSLPHVHTHIYAHAHIYENIDKFYALLYTLQKTIFRDGRLSVCYHLVVLFVSCHLFLIATINIKQGSNFIIFRSFGNFQLTIYHYCKIQLILYLPYFLHLDDLCI